MKRKSKKESGKKMNQEDNSTCLQRLETIQAAASERALEALDQAIRREVAAAVYDLETAAAALPMTAAGLDAAHESLRVTRDRYREGMVQSAELLDAEVALLRAQLERSGAEVRLRLAHIRLDQATGALAATRAALGEATR